MKRIAHCIHHTHWDPFWYFNAQDEEVVCAYNTREMIRAFKEGKIKDFYFDGQTVAIDEYLTTHPEDRRDVEELVKSGKLIIGPFVSQLDPFISCGESVINNLRLGIRNAERLGKASKIAYLADPFGQISEFPKIFNQFGIHEFVFTRGMGDIYNVGNEFYFVSNDGSKVLCNVLLAGYGYGAYAFKDGTLFTEKAEDYNRISVSNLIDRLISRSTLDNEFVFPLGFDQNPIMLNISEKIANYNEEFPEYDFKYTNWKEYFDRVRKFGKNIKEYQGEILSAQFHRIHISGMNSARADIKTIIDEAERLLTYEVQPIMTMLDSLGLPYDDDLLDKAWYTLVNCQTHASATHIDETNEWIKHNALIARNIANGLKIYLLRLLAFNIENQHNDKQIVLVNPLPYSVARTFQINVITKNTNFDLIRNGKKIKFDVLSQTYEYGGVLRKNKELMNEEKHYYNTTIVCSIDEMPGFSYQTIVINEKESFEQELCKKVSAANYIENPHYRIEMTSTGLLVVDKEKNIKIENAIYLEDSGDEGDSYDYSYPSSDYVIRDSLSKSNVSVETNRFTSMMKLTGSLLVPKDLNERERRIRSVSNEYEIIITIDSNNNFIGVSGSIDNKAKNHRTRICFNTKNRNVHSFAGTQFGYIKRDCQPIELANWKENNFFEEPSSTKPLLNHVSSVSDSHTFTVFSKGLKEYDFTGEGYSDVAITIFRSAGYVGLPDLNRRPGRPSGLSCKILETPLLQMIQKISFSLTLCIYDAFDPNQISKDYAIQAIDPLYYQDQKFDLTTHPISYFPMNKLEIVFPNTYQFAEIDSIVGFGTLVKQQGSYILRIYNADSKEIKDIKLFLDNKMTVKRLVDLSGNTINTANCEMMKKGELRNYEITKRKEVI